MLLAPTIKLRPRSADRDERIALGVEQEFDLFVGKQPADFRALFARAIRHVRSVPFRNCDSAAVLDAGYMLACDGREAEFATVPISMRADGPLVLAREVTRCRTHMLGLLRGVGVRSAHGYSTHLSVSVPVGHEREFAEAFSTTVGPALVLLMESRQSPGLLLRTRRGRLEIGSEYLDDERQLSAAITFLAGAVHAYRFNEKAWEGIPRLRIRRWEEANIRPGLYLPPDAYGDPMHELGRAAGLQRQDGRSLTAGEVLQICTDVIARELEDIVNPKALEALHQFARGAGLLQIERQGDPSRITTRWPQAPAPEAKTLVMLAHTAGTKLAPRFVDWEGAAFAWQDAGDPVILGVPWAHLPALFTAARNNEVPGLVSSLGSRDSVLESLDQLQSMQAFQQVDPMALGAQALSDKGSGGAKGGSSKHPGPGKTLEPSGTLVPAPVPQTNQPGPWRRIITGGLTLIILVILITTVVELRQRGRQPSGSPVPTETNTRPALVVPANPVPAFPQASITPTGIGECVPDPVLAYPLAGSIRTGDALLRWSSATPLGPGEEFVVLAARTPSDLTGPNAQAEIVGTTTDTNLALDFAKWKYAGKSGSFYWIVRIQAADGTFLDCGNGKPLSFTVVGAIQPTRPPKEGTPGQPAPFCPPNQVCP